MKKTLKQNIAKLLARADIKINGARPWDIQVLDERFYARLMARGSLGFGESYMDGWWECPAIDELVARIFRADLASQLPLNLGTALAYLQALFLNQGSKSRAFEIGERHYDIGNDLYRAMLDQRLTYTCGYWQNASTLDEAQEAKLDLVCRKIGLQKGQRLLDIGCGWGSLAKFAAENYGAEVVGITVSKEQLVLGRELCQGLPIEIRLQDYREVNEPFDHIVSLGMFEHVGYKNYRAFMSMVERCLKDDGLFLLHTIGANRSSKNTDAWIGKYIFPNSMIPSAAQISRAAEGLLVMEDWHNFGQYYDPTLLAWFHNFDRGWPRLKEKYGERFYRMWKFYLLSCAGGFRARHNQLWQIVFSKRGVAGGYRSIR